MDSDDGLRHSFIKINLELKVVRYSIVEYKWSVLHFGEEEKEKRATTISK